MGLYVCELCSKIFGLRASGAHSCVCPCDVCVALKSNENPVWCRYTKDLENPAKAGVSIKEQLKDFEVVQEKITRRLHCADALLKLLVLRSANIEATKDFYSILGIDFKLEKHGKGPEHYAGLIDGFVLEFYPITGVLQEDHQIRLGFQVSGLDEILELVGPSQGSILKSAHDTPHGRKALIKDPDGRSVELYEKSVVHLDKSD